MKEAQLLRLCYFLLSPENERLSSFLLSFLDEQENSFNKPEQLVAILSVSPDFVTFLNVTGAFLELVDDDEAFRSMAYDGDRLSKEFRVGVRGVDGCYAVGAAYRRCVMTRGTFDSLVQEYELLQNASL